MENKRVFVDSSVLVAACLSSRGASYFCFICAPSLGYKFLINEFVFEEVLDVLKRKFPKELTKFFGFLSFGNFSILKNPQKTDLRRALGIIEEKDAPILISALDNADYLLTLDKEFLKKEVIEFAKVRELTIILPKEFIKFLREVD